MLAMSVILFIVSFLFLMILVFVDNLAEKWAKLPNFCINSVGGKTAICGYPDFYNNKMIHLVRRVGKEYLIAVPNTIVLDDEGWTRWHFLHQQITPNLFVPFVSQRFYSFDEQQTIFAPQQNPEEFKQTIIEQNLKNSWRRRFAKKWAHNPVIDNLQFMLAVVSIMFFLTFVLFGCGAFFDWRSFGSTK